MPTRTEPVPTPTATPDRPWAFLLSTTAAAADLRRHLGSADYSYGFVLKALQPALERLGRWELVAKPESSLSYRAAVAEAQGERPVHLALHPPQNAYFAPDLPNVLFPFWEFPHLPDRDFGHDTRQNWVRMCRGADLILCACTFTADAFTRAGVTAPVALAPVPLESWPFALEPWDPARSWTHVCRHITLGGDPGTATGFPPEPGPGGPVWIRGPRARYRRHLKPWLHPETVRLAQRVRRRVLRVPDDPLPVLPRTPLTLSGLVFTSLFNFSDRRKNARDLLSAFLSAFQDRPDATLVLKLATSASRECYDLAELRELYDALGVAHRCRVVVITDFLDDDAMAGLFRATTFYVNTSKAEGACLPLQQALAAGRPAIAPRHTSMLDYLDEAVGFVVDSSPEPTFWPHDPERRCETTWARLNWTSLRDQYRAAARLAEHDRPGYDRMAGAARARLHAYAGLDAATAALEQALSALVGWTERVPVKRPRAGICVPAGPAR